ncbi:MAG: fumarylacetoacetate hydrolase family protein [Thaumarchaeota archaeon]|nr:fumarylacetoacetate hydrolase family protein [Nitrososphaerota archaeon]
MKVAAFRLRNERVEDERMGLVEADAVTEPKSRASLIALLRGGGVLGSDDGGVSHPISDVVIGPPVRRPGKIVAAIVNTHGMLGGDAKLEWPRLDMKAPSTVIGPGETVIAPPEGIRPEVELAAVIGGTLARASKQESRAGIFGFTILNDVTCPSDSKADAYDAVRRNRATGRLEMTRLRGPLFRSKNHDTFCPTGPWVVTPDEFAKTRDPMMTTKFEGTLVQKGRLSEYIFSPEELVSYVSGFLTLEPGDLVSCGSVGWAPGVLGGLDPTEYILPGKKGSLELEIEGIGVLRNPVAIR